MDHQGLVLVIGGTGQTGYHIVKELLSKGYEVRLLTRSRQNAVKVLGSLFDKVYGVVECDIDQELQIQEKNIKQLIQNPNEPLNSVVDLSLLPSEYGPVKMIVSALGRKPFSKGESTQRLQFHSVVFFTKMCKKHQVQKLVIVSSLCVTRPYNIVSILLNAMVDNVLGWQLKGENYLRKSGLNYLIVRPGGLIGEEKAVPAGFTIGQGDVLNGKNAISRATVARICIDAMESQDIPDKITIDCISTPAQKQQVYAWTPEKYQLRPDDERDISNADHFKAMKIFKFIFIAIVLLILYMIVKQIFL